ncbi:MAG: permease-like cell division protein FtsX [Paludibacteraceae bacterium]|nr:permease-like cell division protein FtsX [Paludibacteraceae bacterium]
MKWHRFFNMYLTTTISVAMVLFLVGLECVMLISAHSMIGRIRENVALTVILTPESDTAEVTRMKTVLDAVPYMASYQYISKQDALDEHIRQLGEDPVKFLGFNPLMDSYDVHLKPAYTNSDSIAVIVDNLTALPYVEKVLYQEDVVRVLDTNVSRVSLILLICAGVLLIVAWVLIVNTIRLHVYSKRFLINTMRLVGATQWIIRAPFIRRSVRMGVEAAILSLVLIGGILYYVFYQLGVVLFEINYENLLFLVGTVLLSGILLTLFASLFATGRYVRMKVDAMYEI